MEMPALHGLEPLLSAGLVSRSCCHRRVHEAVHCPDGGRQGGALYREQISIAPQRTLTEAKLYCGKIKPNYFYNSLEVCYSFRGCDICSIFTEGCSQCQSVGEHFYLLEKKTKLYDFSKFYASGIASERFSV